MDLHSLTVFFTVATEKSFSRAATKLLRTQPAISLAVQRLEQELGEKLIDRSGKDLMLTDAGRTVLEYARRFQSLQQELDNSIAELRDNSAGRLAIGANESMALYYVRFFLAVRQETATLVQIGILLIAAAILLAPIRRTAMQINPWLTVIVALGLAVAFFAWADHDSKLG